MLGTCAWKQVPCLGGLRQKQPPLLSGLVTEEHLGTRLACPIDGLLLPPGDHCGKDNGSHSPQKATWKPDMRTAAPGTTRVSWAMRIWQVSDRTGERPRAQPRVGRWNGKGLDAWLRHLPPSCQTPLIWADAVLGAWWALGTRGQTAKGLVVLPWPGSGLSALTSTQARHSASVSSPATGTKTGPQVRCQLPCSPAIPEATLRPARTPRLEVGNLSGRKGSRAMQGVQLSAPERRGQRLVQRRTNMRL